MRRVTPDSNILVSALMFRGKPLAVLELGLTGDAIAAETLRVLRDKFKLEPDRPERVVPTETIDAVPSDPDDNRVLECARAAAATVIVTGDDDLLRLGSYAGIRIVKPAEFLDRWREL
jgi:hypothetical protein